MPHEIIKIITVISDIKHHEIIMIFLISLHISRAVPSSRLRSRSTELQITISAFHRLRSTMRAPRASRASRTCVRAAQHSTTDPALAARSAHGARTAPSVRTPWSPQPDTCTIPRTHTRSVQSNSPLSSAFPLATPGVALSSTSARLLIPHAQLAAMASPLSPCRCPQASPVWLCRRAQLLILQCAGSTAHTLPWLALPALRWCRRRCAPHAPSRPLRVRALAPPPPRALTPPWCAVWPRTAGSHRGS